MRLENYLRNIKMLEMHHEVLDHFCTESVGVKSAGSDKGVDPMGLPFMTVKYGRTTSIFRSDRDNCVPTQIG